MRTISKNQLNVSVVALKSKKEKIAQRTRLPLLAACAVLVFCACTKSPLETVDAPAKQKTIAGKVALEDFISPEETFVWLEGFNLGTRADQGGGYQIELPEKGFQSVLPGGVEGVFKLYFFNANYFIKTLDLVVLNGEFVNGKGDILSTGALSRHLTLANIVTIRTEVSVPAIKASYDSTLTVSVLVSPVDIADSVKVRFPDLAEQSVARVFLKGIESDNMLNLTSSRFSVAELGEEPLTVDELTSLQEVRDRPLLLTIELEWRSGLAAADDYWVLPYLLIDHQDVPVDLLENMGVDLSNPLESFHKIPYGIHAAKLMVLPSE